MIFNNNDLYNCVNIIKEYQKSCPVKIISLANKLGITVYRANMSKNISGAIFGKNLGYDNEKYLIYVNGSHHINRQRFTIAHEIAHFLLHREKIGDNLTDSALYRSKLSNTQERQANILASELLIPLHLLKDYINKGVRNIQTLSNIFEVSKEAMKIRLENEYNVFLEE